MIDLKFFKDRYDLSFERALRFRAKLYASGKGRDTLRHSDTIEETLAMADEQCQQAADTIRALIWGRCFYDMQAMQVAASP